MGKVVNGRITMSRKLDGPRTSVVQLYAKVDHIRSVVGRTTSGSPLQVESFVVRT